MKIGSRIESQVNKNFMAANSINKVVTLEHRVAVIPEFSEFDVDLIPLCTVVGSGIRNVCANHARLRRGFHAHFIQPVAKGINRSDLATSVRRIARTRRIGLKRETYV